MVIFMVQVITGIWLMMFYTNTEEGAFASIEYIMRDVEYGLVNAVYVQERAHSFLDVFSYV